MTHGAAVEEKGALAAPQCQHHWLIESPHGTTSWGTCKRCGERRQFTNSASDALWDGEGIPGGEGEPEFSYAPQAGFLEENDEG